MKGATRLWYTSPAAEWVEALPLGNGRIGIMAFGGVREDRYALNEDTLWSGYPKEHRREYAPEALARAQELVREGRLKEAQQVVERDVTCDFTQAYMPLGDLTVTHVDLPGETKAYTRSLDLETGLHTVEFTAGSTRYLRECFCSFPDQAFILLISANKPGAVSFDLRLDTQLKRLVETASEYGDNHVRLQLGAVCPSKAAPKYIETDVPFVYEEDPAKRGVRARAIADVQTDGGRAWIEEGMLCVRGANSACVRLAIRTSFNGFDRLPWIEGRDCEADAQRDIEAAREDAYANQRERHVNDFTSHMRACDFHLHAKRADMPTLQRLIAFAENGDDPELYELIFQYGRYLTVAASRPGTQATNLQGIWNDTMRPPWSSNYTININTEMNYWPTESTNLAEMTEPLFRLIENVRKTGAAAAETFYGARGVVSHHNTDIWALANPVGEQRENCMVWAFWPMSFGWLCRHLFDHYLYSGDVDFLRDTALPALRDATRFYCDALREDGNGYLSIYPATSPENNFIVNGETLCGAANATMQDAILKEVFDEYLQAVDILGLHEPLADEAQAARARIRPYQIGSKGQLLEWTEEYEEAEPHHRHQSHLYPLHPGAQITEETKDLFNACRRTLELRGDEGTGWSLGWKINLWARLNEGAHALALLKMQLRLVGEHNIHYEGGGGTYPNLFDAHPPFQIDGNYGATAGIAEMLLRSRPGVCTLLPALPPEWQDGGITGLRAMGGLTVDIQFTEGRLERARVCADKAPAAPVRVLYEGRELFTVDRSGEFEIRP